MTGVYDPSMPSNFVVDEILWEKAMQRDAEVVIDVGSFYASKTFLSPQYGRLLWGWLPEERLTDAHGAPFGWAGVMSLPREIIPYKSGNSWLIRTPPLEAVVDNLRESTTTYEVITVGNNNFYTVDGAAGQQLEIRVHISTTSVVSGGECGVRVLSSAASNIDSPEYSDVGIEFAFDNIGVIRAAALYVDASMSCSNSTAKVNRTKLSSGSLDSIYFSDPETVEIQVIVDHSVIEAFLEGGRRAVTRRVYPSDPTKSIEVQAFSKCPGEGTCGQCTFTNLTLSVLRSVDIIDSLDSATDSSNNDDESNLEDWEISLIVIIPLVVVASAVMIYFTFFRKTADPAKDDLIQSRL